MENSEKKDDNKSLDLQWICPNNNCGANNYFRRPICRNPNCKTEKPK